MLNSKLNLSTVRSPSPRLQSPRHTNLIQQEKQELSSIFTLETQCNHPNFEKDFMAWLFSKGYSVQQFFKNEPTLESLFLKLTQFAWKKTQL